MSFLRGREVHLSVILIIALLGVLSGWAIGCNIPMRPENNMPAFWGLLLNNVKVGGMVIVAGLLTLGVGALFLVGFNMMFMQLVESVPFFLECFPMPHAKLLQW